MDAREELNEFLRKYPELETEVFIILHCILIMYRKIREHKEN